MKLNQRINSTKEYTCEIAYLTQGYTAGQSQTVWYHSNLHADDACYVSSISSDHPNRQQHSCCPQHMHQDTAAVLSPTWRAKRRVSVSHDRQSSEVNSWQSTMMSLWNWAVELCQCHLDHINTQTHNLLTYTSKGAMAIHLQPEGRPTSRQ